MATTYSVGEIIVYGGTGVCRVQEIAAPRAKGPDAGRRYYVLKPLFQDGTISIPVDTKVFMRPVISAQEAERLIDALPTLKAEAYHDRNFNQLAAHYDQVLGSHDCRDIARLAMSIHAKQRWAEQQSKKLGQVDARYMKRAEGLLFGELSVALGIPRDDVPDYIERRVGARRREMPGLQAAE